MINLTPITKNIQKRLFEKMKVLGRETSTSPNQPAKGGSGLTHAKMATRSTFVRMTSGATNAVILMGGMLKDDLSIPGGYGDIYGSRSYKINDESMFSMRGTQQEEFNEEGELELADAYTGGVSATINKLSNKFKRPIPGIKSIDVSFKGGLRALREATISWTCWSWSELDALENHFLAHGKTVMVEWGWVYDKKTLQKLPDFLNTDDAGNRFISANAFTDYRNKITDADGDFDMMVGIIKNFEWTTRDDGGFDCQTILTSVGASVMENPQPGQEALDPSITYNISIKDDTKDIQGALEKATGELGEESKKTQESPLGYDVKGRAENSDSLIDLNTNVTMKAFIRKIDEYLLEQGHAGLPSKNTIKTEDLANSGEGFKRSGGSGNYKYFIYEPNKYILEIDNMSGLGHKGKGYITSTLYREGLVKNAWVKWGWFEDNILSKFLSVTSDERIITEFRSIEKLQMVDGKDSNIYESVRIKNHERLETTNLNQFILPGQFIAQPPIKFEGNIAVPTIKLPGDKLFLQVLSTITNDRENFKPFTTVTDIFETKIGYGLKITTEDIMKDETWDRIDNPTKVGEKKTYETEYKSLEVPIPGKHGYLRNMLINTKVIKDAFGVGITDDFTVESINLIEALESMFSILNQELNFWNFNVTVDEIDTHRAKIIDDQITNHKFDKPTDEQKSRVDETGEVSTLDSDGNKGDEGVFFFPVWQHNSLVKTQNITAKIPDALQLSIMYGANMDVVKDFGNPGSQFADKRGIIAGGLHNDYNDKSNRGIDIAFRNKTSRNIGLKSSDETIPLQKDGGEDITDFINRNSEELEMAYEKRLAEVNKSLKASSGRLPEPDLPYDESVPPPLFNYLSAEELIEILLVIVRMEDGDNPVSPEALQLYSQKFNDDGSMRSPFVASINFRTTNYGTGARVTTPVLVPLEIELAIDGIGGIYPGNSFHSTYVPSKYQKLTVFQCFDVNHKLDSSDWTTTISGKMRSTIDSAFKFAYTDEQLTKEQRENYMNLQENKAAASKRTLDLFIGGKTGQYSGKVSPRG